MSLSNKIIPFRMKRKDEGIMVKDVREAVKELKDKIKDLGSFSNRNMDIIVPQLIDEIFGGELVK